MANGRPGDNPISDVVVHQMEVFGTEIDTLMREIAAISKPALYKLPAHLFAFASRDELLKELVALKERLYT